MSDDLTIPDVPLVALVERLRATAARVEYTNPVVASALRDIAVDVARLVRRVAELEAARPSATVVAGPWRRCVPGNPAAGTWCDGGDVA